MKHLFLILALCFSFNAFADQRFETWQGLCHFAYDPNDDDNEVYFANCDNTIDTHDSGDGQGRLAYGSSITSSEYYLPDMVTPKFAGVNKLKGVDADAAFYGDEYTEAVNTQCVMVTSNYNAGADDNNETVYVTNNWNLEISQSTDANLNQVVAYKLSCRDGVAQ